MVPVILESLCAEKFLLCSILPGLICIWNDVYENMCKVCLDGTFMCASSFCCAIISRLCSLCMNVCLCFCICRHRCMYACVRVCVAYIIIGPIIIVTQLN